MQYLVNDLSFGDDMRMKVMKGATVLGKAVGSTMGAKGRKVLIETEFDVKVTMDGISAAKAINFEDKYEQLGATLVREAAQRTNEAAGDGTTTATVLTVAMMQEGQKLVAAGFNPVLLARGMRTAKEDVIHVLKSWATPIHHKDDYYNVAFISSRDEKIATLISEVMAKVGKDGVITIEKGESDDIEVQYTEGMEFAGGLSLPYFINDHVKQQAVMEDTFVLVYDGKIKDVKELLPVINKVAGKEGGSRRLVIIAEELSESALSTVLANNSKGSFGAIHVNPSEWGDRRKEFLKDIAVLTGATVISPKMGVMLKDTTLEQLGTAKKILSNRQTTTIVQGGGSKELVDGRIAEMEEQVKIAESQFDKDRIKERKARIQNGVVVIKVGAPTEPAQIEKLDRVEDALGAARSAAEEGIIPGGGAAYAKIAMIDVALSDKDEQAGAQLVLNVLPCCLKQIVSNAGGNASLVLANVQATAENNMGWDAMTGEIKDLIAAGIIDPVKVQRLAVENAVSIASMFLESDTAVIFKTKDDVPPK